MKTKRIVSFLTLILFLNLSKQTTAAPKYNETREQQQLALFKKEIKASSFDERKKIICQRTLPAAAKEGFIDLVRECIAVGKNLTDGFDVDATLGDKTAFGWAVYKEQFAFADILLAAGADINLPQDEFGNTALHLATQKAKEIIAARIVTYLLSHNANPNVQNVHGYTPLHHATMHGKQGIVLMLLAAGADKNIRTTDERNATAYEIALQRGNEEIASILNPYPNISNPFSLHKSNSF